MATDKLLTLKEVTGYLKLTDRTLYRLTQDGERPGCEVGDLSRFRLGDIDAWIDNRKAGACRAGERR